MSWLHQHIGRRLLPYERSSLFVQHLDNERRRAEIRNSINNMPMQPQHRGAPPAQVAQQGMTPQPDAFNERRGDYAVFRGLMVLLVWVEQHFAFFPHDLRERWHGRVEPPLTVAIRNLKDAMRTLISTIAPGLNIWFEDVENENNMMVSYYTNPYSTDISGNDTMGAGPNDMSLHRFAARSGANWGRQRRGGRDLSDITRDNIRYIFERIESYTRHATVLATQIHMETAMQRHQLEQGVHNAVRSSAVGVYMELYQLLVTVLYFLPYIGTAPRGPAYVHPRPVAMRLVQVRQRVDDGTSAAHGEDWQQQQQRAAQRAASEARALHGYPRAANDNNDDDSNDDYDRLPMVDNYAREVEAAQRFFPW